MLTMRIRSTIAVTGAVSAALLSSTARAQITEVARTPVANVSELTFGYRCDDRFVIRNDGAASVDLEYAIEKGTEHTRFTLGPRELLELDSKAKGALELWMDGKLIAKALKEKRACKDVAGTASVMVAPLEVTTNEPERRSANTFGAYPFFDPWMSGYYGYYSPFGFRPFYRGFIGVPIVIGNRGGVRRGR